MIINESDKNFALYSKLSKLAEAINYFLSYIELVAEPNLDNSSRPHFITESAVRFPFAEYLERRLGVVDIELEHRYKKFSGKRCDFSFSIPECGTCLVELKYVKGTISLQDYFDDIMRLHFGAKTEEKRAFFIVCGMTEDIVQNFQRRTINLKAKHKTEPYKTLPTTDKRPKSSTVGNKWLTFRSCNPKKMFVSLSYWEHFVGKHPEAKDGKPDYIITKKVCYMGNNNKSIGPHSIGIWEIQ